MSITGNPSIFKRISGFFFPPNRAIGRMPAPRSSAPVQTRPMPIATRSMKPQSRSESGAPLEKKASRPVSWTVRFQLQLFSARLKLSRSDSGLKALRADIKSLKAHLKNANCPVTVKKLESLKLTIDQKLSKRDPRNVIPLAGGPTYGGW